MKTIWTTSPLDHWIGVCVCACTNMVQQGQCCLHYSRINKQCYPGRLTIQSVTQVDKSIKQHISLLSYLLPTKPQFLQVLKLPARGWARGGEGEGKGRGGDKIMCTVILYAATQSFYYFFYRRRLLCAFNTSWRVASWHWPPYPVLRVALLQSFWQENKEVVKLWESMRVLSTRDLSQQLKSWGKLQLDSALPSVTNMSHQDTSSLSWLKCTFRSKHNWGFNMKWRYGLRLRYFRCTQQISNNQQNQASPLPSCSNSIL